MVYIFETQLNDFNTLIKGLSKIYGLNLSSTTYCCKNLGFSKNLRFKDLSEDQLQQLIKVIEKSNFKLNFELKNFTRISKEKLVKIKSYRGLRGLAGLPVRGQRTHTNARTCKKRFNKSN